MLDIEVHWHINPAGATSAAAAGLNRAVETVAPIVTQRTPRLYGDLRASMNVHHASAGNLEAGISFTSPYARYQHELAAAYRSTPGTSSHFLSGPWKENADLMRQIVAQAITEGLNG